MPLHKCQEGGSPGYKWGDQGKCYTGPGAKEKALKQGRAIERSKHMKGEKTTESPKDILILYIYDSEE